MIDLHTHSTASDGTYSPSELINKACELGLKVIALTDHDTLKGIKEAKEAAKDRIIFIPGVEVSIEWSKGECHLLGLGVKEDSYMLNNLLCTLQNAREERGHLIARKLKEAGFDIKYEEIAKLATGTVGRPHFASYMCEKKIVKSVQEAFDKYLGLNRPFYVPKKNADLKEAILAIKDANGIPVLAHPMSLYRSWKYLPSVIHSFKELGLIGLEAWHPGARYGDCKRLEALAKKEGLIITASSDFHGERRKDRFLGRTCNNMIIEDIYFENLIGAGLTIEKT
ncbi:MAG: PHP domain-containing protein [Treponema sp.]